MSSSGVVFAGSRLTCSVNMPSGSQSALRGHATPVNSRMDSDKNAYSSHGFLGDRMPTKVPRVDRAALARVCDVERLVARVEELLARGPSAESQPALK